MVYICRKCNIPKQRPKTIEIRHFKNFDANQFQNYLEYAFGYYTCNSDPNSGVDKGGQGGLTPPSNELKTIITERMKSEEKLRRAMTMRNPKK